jgi:hypothetical protein
MPPPFRRLTTAQFVALIQSVQPALTRKLTAVHLHHTWRPTQSQFNGLPTIEAMHRFHVDTNGWNDIAQHLTIDPQGMSWTGRNWNRPPASQPGKNGTGEAGPFMIEIVGDFDIGRDALDGDQRQAVVEVVAAILAACDLTTAAVLFHNELGSPKTCPGTSVRKDELMGEIDAALASLPATAATPRTPAKKAAARSRDAARRALPFSRDFVLHDSVAADVDAPPAGFESWGVQEHALAAHGVEEQARPLVRASIGTRDLTTVLERTSKWEPLRPHVVNLTKGRLSQGGQFEMPPGAIDGIMDAIEHYAGTVDAPRLMMHAHGGLVSETSALSYALAAHKWWLDQGVYPIYFVWETSAFEIIKQRLGISRGFGDWWDRRFERFARPVGKPLWSDMKESALLSSSPDAGDGDAGGAWKFAKALATLIQKRPAGKDVRLHAVGHSAGAIFQAHYLPRLLERGLTLDSLALLAPAIRIDLFKSHLLQPVMGGAIKRFEMYTMDEEAEKDDDLIEALGVPIYGKSLLYLVSGAFEPEEDAAILGLDERFRTDATIAGLFGPGKHRLEFSHARGKPHNPATKARKHGCFDNDDATLQSIFQTITGSGAASGFPASDDSCVKASSRALPPELFAPRSLAFPATGAFAAGPLVTGPTGPVRTADGTGRRALCVGIDSYPTAPLGGCVRDAQAWAAALRSLQFDVTTLLDTQATRARVLDALSTLVAGARPGELIVFQYSGHGTQAEDINGDESDRFDEALVPIDYESGALLLDDDLAEVYRQLPAGAVLTLFMDCCHSGTNSRFAPIDRTPTLPSERRRFLRLTPELEAAHRQFRAREGSPVPTTPEESLPGLIHFAACLDNQFAYESAGQGHFTRIVTAGLAAAVSSGVTNESFASDIAAKVIAIGRPQTPRLMHLPAALANRPVFDVLAAAPVAPAPGGGLGAFATDEDMAEWCLQFFEAGAAYWRQRVGR